MVRRALSSCAPNTIHRLGLPGRNTYISFSPIFHILQYCITWPNRCASPKSTKNNTPTIVDTGLEKLEKNFFVLLGLFG
jgi:hypothetical protein